MRRKIPWKSCAVHATQNVNKRAKSHAKQLEVHQIPISQEDYNTYTGCVHVEACLIVQATKIYGLRRDSGK